MFTTIAAERIGDLAGSCDIHIKRKIINPLKVKVCFIVHPACNKTLINMFRKHIFILETTLGKILIDISKDKLIENELFLKVNEDIFAYKEYSIVGPQISLSSNQISQGYSKLKKIGITKNDWWVCFHVREETYLKNLKLYKKRDLSYHSYRDFSEESLHKGIEEVTKRGGYVFLMSERGKSTAFNNNPHVIQYNNNTFKTGFLDIFLCSQAKFFIGNTSGITSVPKILGVPVGVCNQIGFNHFLQQKKSLTIYKKLFCLTTQKILTYDEMFKNNYFDQYKGWVEFTTDSLKKRNVIAVENSSDEILGLVKDMFNIINKKNTNKYDIELQNNFKSYFYSKQKNIKLAGNIAPSFVKLNTKLFPNLSKQ